MNIFVNKAFAKSLMRFNITEHWSLSFNFCLKCSLLRDLYAP